MTIDTKASPALTLQYLSRFLIEFCKENGIPIEKALENTNINSSSIASIPRTSEVWQDIKLIENIIKTAPHIMLGVEIGRSARISSFGCLGYAMMTAPTLGEAFELAEKHPALMGEHFIFKIEKKGRTAYLTTSSSDAPLTIRNTLTDMSFFTFIAICRDMLGFQPDLEGIYFTHTPSPVAQEQYKINLNAMAEFGAVESAIVFKSDLLEHPLPLANTLCHAEMRSLCQQQENELSPGREWFDKFTALLGSSLKNPLDVEQLAVQMHCSSRTLRRQLSSRSTSYRLVLDKLRFEKARDILSHTDSPIEVIAEELGFSDRTAFSRAFKRWCGLPPQAYRP
ncbi:helix-turn-helix domain-containing protein [Pseudomonas sp. BGr12]|uniref:helix-turn-helix domain-containing protein n=1 Tax=Pseudomonas sp. BGr12 TaxID=2936269 RepID=UPI002559ED0D|nr:AraC family transcriptional regulator [Pseudomonas sp. BJa5]MDL2428390.1 AraC family transcriptional regulator [Pseudomonas sp. BJa5]